MRLCYNFLMDTFSKPEKIIAQIEIPELAHIADFGAGAGAYAMLLAQRPEVAKIFAIDVKKEMVERLAKLSEEEGHHKIQVVWADIDQVKGSRLRDESVHIVLLINTLFQLEDRKAGIREAYRVLKPYGQLVLVDWAESFGGIGPHEDQVVSERVARILTEEENFVFENELDAGAHHYGFVSRKHL